MVLNQTRALSNFSLKMKNQLNKMIRKIKTKGRLIDIATFVIMMAT